MSIDNSILRIDNNLCGLKSPFEEFHKFLVSGNFNNFPLRFIRLAEHEYFFKEFSVNILVG
jgi:hypothetical protein